MSKKASGNVFEHSLFIKTTGVGKILIFFLYVDDLIFIGKDEVMSKEFKRSMTVEFDMTDIRRMSHFLGIEVMQMPNGIFIS